MKFSTKFIAPGLLSLFVTATAGAHGTDHPAKAQPAAQKVAKAPMTCAELAIAKKSKNALVTPDMQATEKRCKAEADDAEKTKAAVSKTAAGNKK